jgi:small membrane protein
VSLFQIIVGPFTFVGFVWCAWKCVRGPGRYVRVVSGLLALAWASGCMLVLDPGLTTVLAGIFGIGRGVDLVVYLFMVLAFCYAIRMYYKLCDIRKDITLIVSHIAIAERQIPTEKATNETTGEQRPSQHKDGQQVRTVSAKPMD